MERPRFPGLRSIARAAVERASQMRQHNPDNEYYHLHSVTEDGRMNLRRPHWPAGVYIGNVPLRDGSDAGMLMPGMVIRAEFEEGNRQLPYGCNVVGAMPFPVRVAGWLHWGASLALARFSGSAPGATSFGEIGGDASEIPFGSSLRVAGSYAYILGLEPDQAPPAEWVVYKTSDGETFEICARFGEMMAYDNDYDPGDDPVFRFVPHRFDLVEDRNGLSAYVGFGSVDAIVSPTFPGVTVNQPLKLGPKADTDDPTTVWWSP